MKQTYFFNTGCGGLCDCLASVKQKASEERNFFRGFFYAPSFERSAGHFFY